MEIWRLLVGSGLRRWLLVLLPVVAAAAAALVVWNRPVQHEAVARVSIPQSPGHRLDRYNVPPYADAVRVATTDRDLLGRVIGSRTDTFAINVQRLEESPIVEVHVVSPQLERLSDVTQRLARDALVAVMANDLASAERIEQQIRTELAQVRRRLDALSDDAGAVEVADFNDRLALELAGARGELAAARAAGDPGEASQAVAAVTELEAQLSRLAPHLADFRSLDAERERRERSLEEAEEILSIQRALVGTAESGETITLSGPTVVSRLSAMLQAAATALAATLAVLLMIAVLLDIRQAGPTPRSARTYRPSGGPTEPELPLVPSRRSDSLRSG
jgi:hypothetical protein